MIVDKEGNLFEDRRRKDRIKVEDSKTGKEQKNRRKTDRRKENNKIRKK